MMTPPSGSRPSVAVKLISEVSVGRMETTEVVELVAAAPAVSVSAMVKVVVTVEAVCAGFGEKTRWSSAEVTAPGVPVTV